MSQITVIPTTKVAVYWDAFYEKNYTHLGLRRGK